MENKKEENKNNRFTYSDDEGLKVLSEKEILDSIGNNKDNKLVEKSQQNEFGKSTKFKYNDN